MDLADVRSKPGNMTESLKSQELVTTVTNFTRSWSERRLKSSVLVRSCLRSTYISKSSPNLRWVSGDTLWRWWRESLSLRGHRHNWPGSGYHSEERVIKGHPHTSYPPPAPLALQCIGREASTRQAAGRFFLENLTPRDFSTLAQLAPPVVKAQIRCPVCLESPFWFLVVVVPFFRYEQLRIFEEIL